MTDSPLQAALPAGADGLHALEAGTGLIIAHGCWAAWLGRIPVSAG
jgi:hypothetical protein